MTSKKLDVGSSLSGAGTLSLTSGLLLFAPLALLGNAIGAVFKYPEVGAAVLYPPYAALTAVLILSPRRDWAWYLLAGFIAHFVTHWPRWSASWVLFADLANVARSVTAVLLLVYFFRVRQLDSIGALLRFLLVVSVVAPVVGATIGAANVVWHDRASIFAVPWTAWFLSNAITGLTILPATLFALEPNAVWRRGLTSQRLIEAILLGVTLIASFVLVVIPPDGGPRQFVLWLYAPLPALIWAALRFGISGASLGLAGATLGAVLTADRGVGPFLTSSRDESIIIVQLFAALTSIPILCIAVISSANRAAAELHRVLLASIHDDVAVIDSRGNILECNGAWRRSAERAGAEPYHRARIGDNYVEACRVAARQGNGIAARKLSGVMSVLSGERRRFDMDYSLAESLHGARYALSVEMLAWTDGGALVRRADHTARHRAQMERDEQRRELSHLARVASLGQLSGALAHELNQPLASIGSNAEAARLLVTREHPDLPLLNDILRDIVEENQRAAEVIRRLRAMLKRGETHLQPLDAGDLIREVLELAHAELITRRVTPICVVEPGLPLVLGDRIQLQQVLLNLILNACEAMGSTSQRKLTVRVTRTVNNTTQISIRDTGIGISSVLMARLFEPFVTTKEEGLGLGLSISRTIIASHGGRLWAENNPDGGATLHCVLISAAVPEGELGRAFLDWQHRDTQTGHVTAAPAGAPLGGGTAMQGRPSGP